MPQLDTTLEGVAPWMTAPPLPKTTSFMEAFRMAQEQNSPQALADLKLKQQQIQHLGFQMQNDQLLLQKNKFDLENALAGKQAETEVSSEMAKVQDWSDPASVARVLDTYSKRPTAPSRSLVNEAVTMHKEAVTAKERADAIQARIKAAEISAGKGTPEERKAAVLTRLQNDLEKATASGNPALIEPAQRALDNFLVFGPQTETTTIETPGGPTITTTKGGQTAAAKAQIEKKLSASQESYDQLKETIASINPATVGPAGKLREGYETLANMVAPGSVAPTTTEARQNMRISVQRTLAAFRESTGGRMNVLEQGMLKDIGDVTGWLESADTARANLGVLLKLEASKTVRDSKRIKRPAPDWALKTMDYPQVVAGFKEGWITPEETRRWFDQHPEVQQKPE